jgi:hypothetical protein
MAARFNVTPSFSIIVGSITASYSSAMGLPQAFWHMGLTTPIHITTTAATSAFGVRLVGV